MKKLLLSLFVLVFVAAAATAQTRTVTGTVTGQSDGLSLPGVSIQVKGTSDGTSTDNNGRFSIQAPAGATLVFTYIGFETRELAVPASGSMTVVLAESAQSLDDVVITAGGVSIQQRQQGNQATNVTAETLTQGKSFNVAQSLSGKVAGLQVNAVGGGVNPEIRLVLRGNRSLLGNNQALVVVDNVIVPTSVLGNLNPEDIESVNVLNGAGAASLYGSDASNGALIITTKRGKEGVSRITVSNTSTFENASFLPKLQKRFGSGTGPDAVPTYTPYENQQYGPAFDGSMVTIGKPTENGNIQTIPYSPTDERDQFWDNGYTNQTDLSISSGDEKSSYYLSAQYLENTGTVPGDKYNRFSMRLNADRNITDNFTVSFNSNYTQNRYDRSNAMEVAFNDVLQSPAHIPLTRYKDWRNDEFANPNGYYNEYYDNPYFTLDNNRELVRNDYLTGSTQFKWFPIEKLSLLFRVSLAARNGSSKSWSNRFDFSEYTSGISSSKEQGEYPGSVADGSFFETQINPEFQAQFKDQLSEDFSIDAILGGSLRDNNAKYLNASSFGMAQPDLFNISNTTQRTQGGESIERVRQIGIYGDVRIGFRNYLYLHMTGRNDWRSQLSVENRSFFYPSADVSFILSDAVPTIKESGVIDVLKFRGGVSKVGLVNIGPYALLATFGQTNGFPYNGVIGYSIGDRAVAPNINPEITNSMEGGFDFELLQSRVVGSFTAYKSTTTDQTLPVQVTSSTGYTSFLTNTGEVTNNGFETMLRLTPIRTDAGLEVTVGANYTYNDNKVVSLFEGQEEGELTLGTWGAAGVYAVTGEAFPMLKGTRYQRDDQDRIIVNPSTGFPTVTTEYYQLGRTEPPHRLGLDGILSYKGLRFATTWEYRSGHSMFNQSTTGLDFSGAGIKSTFFNRERFVIPNSVVRTGGTDEAPVYTENTNITTYTGGVDFWTNGPSNTGVAENYVYSAAYWRLREASISYDLPSRLFEDMGYVKGVRVSLQGRNLLLWTPKTNLYTDPEYSAFAATSNAIGISGLNDAPPARYFGFTLSVNL